MMVRRSKALTFNWWRILSGQTLPFWGMQLPSFLGLKILEEYNKDLVFFSEEIELEIQAATPLMFGQSFTKQTAGHLTRAKGSDSCNVFNTKCIINPEVHDQSTGGIRNSHFATNWKVIVGDQWVLRTVHIPFREELCQIHLSQPYQFSEERMKHK